MSERFVHTVKSPSNPSSPNTIRRMLRKAKKSSKIGISVIHSVVFGKF